MRRLGTILIILGVNIAVWSVGAAFWRAALECAMVAQGGMCPEGTGGLFIKLMTSPAGLIYWLAVLVGLSVFWWGKRIRAASSSQE